MQFTRFESLLHLENVSRMAGNTHKWQATLSIYVATSFWPVSKFADSLLIFLPSLHHPTPALLALQLLSKRTGS